MSMTYFFCDEVLHFQPEKCVKIKKCLFYYVMSDDVLKILVEKSDRISKDFLNLLSQCGFRTNENATKLYQATFNSVKNNCNNPKSWINSKGLVPFIDLRGTSA